MAFLSAGRLHKLVLSRGYRTVIGATASRGDFTAEVGHRRSIDRMHGRSRDVDPVALDPTQARQREEPTEAPGVWATRMAIARGEVSTEALLPIVLLHPGERGAILHVIQEALGNAKAAELEAAYLAQLPPDPAQELLAWQPTEVGGARGQAAWLLRAVELGWVDAHGQTRKHLRAYVDGAASVESTEGIPSPANDRGIKPKREVGGGRGVYDVKLGDAPILETLHALVRNHVDDSYARRHYHAHALFDLGTMLRRDHGFGGSRHTIGEAIDLGGMNFETVDDVLHVLELLPEGRVANVFPDNDDHLHLAVHGDAFELGLPFQGNFFRDDDNLVVAQRRAEAAAATDATTLHAEGLSWGSTVVNVSTAQKTSGGWAWSKPAGKAGGRAAVSFLVSKALREKLAAMMKA